MGIPIKLHLTFLIILAVFLIAFSMNYSEILGFTLGFGALETDWGTKYAFGAAAAIIFFITILIHELAHSYMAIRYGVRIRSITLMIFGGVATMEEIPKKPGQELKMAFAGPLSSLAMGLGAYGLMQLITPIDSNSILFEGILILLGLMAFYNIFLAAFNLLPAFPMDGGRILRSALATRMSHLEATKKAAAVGRFSAIAMGMFAIWQFNIFLIMIAVFIYFAAKDEEQATVVNDSLEGVSVASLMSTDVKVVHPDTSVQQLIDLMYYTRHKGFPVVDRGLIGMVTLEDTKKLSMDMFRFARVRDVMTSPATTVTLGTAATDALKLMGERKVSRLAVVNESGSLVGIITRKDFLRVVDIAAVRKQRANWGAPRVRCHRRLSRQLLPLEHYHADCQGRDGIDEHY